MARSKYGITEGGRVRVRKYWRARSARRNWVGEGGMLGLILICVAAFASVILIKVVLVLL